MLSENFTYDHSLTYLSSPDGIFAVAESTSSGFRLHYVHTDNLGSWDIITDMGGDLEQSLSFDAWGNRRNASTWNGPAHDVPLFDRGFTGHEHLYNFGLINMNGRVYDPLVARMLSPDIVIQDEQNSQAYNRYSYCFNNPLRFTDPSGYIVRGHYNILNWSSTMYYDVDINRNNGNSFNTDLSEGIYSPIYDVNGNFLGTDDEGLQGEAIVMRKEDFKQGMSHQDALSFATDLAENNKEEAEMRMNLHYASLRNRPDWDGYLTKQEADEWWLNGNGEPLFVNMEKIALHGITTDFFNNEVGQTKTKNFIWHFPLTETGKTYGTLTMTLINLNTGEISIGPKGHDHMDKYDFFYDGRFFRDFATWIGKPKGNGINYLIYGYGHPKVPIKY